MDIYRVAGYVKLAKRWQQSKDTAISLHYEYFKEECAGDPNIKLVGVYIDITGNKHIYDREEMVRLIKDCKQGRIDVILTPTRAYLAANSKEFCFLLNYLFSLPYPIEIVSDDDDLRIDTVANVEHQKESLKRMAYNYAIFVSKEYEAWKKKLVAAMNDLS